LVIIAQSVIIAFVIRVPKRSSSRTLLLVLEKLLTLRVYQVISCGVVGMVQKKLQFGAFVQSAHNDLIMHNLCPLGFQCMVALPRQKKKKCHPFAMDGALALETTYVTLLQSMRH
jgi:hypothetical protein